MFSIPEGKVIVLYGKKFEILEFIGEGNSGGVWKVKDPLGYPQALKILYKVKEKNKKQNAIKKIEALKKQKYTHFIEVKNIGIFSFDSYAAQRTQKELFEVENAFPCFTMPLSDINFEVIYSMTKVLQLKLVIQLCLAVRKIHNVKKTELPPFHGNLKESNILLFRPKNRDIIKILDWGLTKEEGKKYDDYTYIKKFITSTLTQIPDAIKEEMQLLESSEEKKRGYALNMIIQKLWEVQKKEQKQELANSFFTLGVNLYNEAHYDYALLDFKRAIALKPNFVEALVYTGNTLKFLDQHDKALEKYNEAIRFDPKNHFAFECRGEFYGEQENFDKAIEDFLTALNICPESASSCGGLAIAYTYKKQYDKALEQLNKLITIENDFAPAYIDRAEVFCKLEKYDKALQDYNKALELETEESEEVEEKIELIKKITAKK